MHESGDNKTSVTVYEKLVWISNGRIIDLRTEHEKNFIRDCFNNLVGAIDPNICNEDLRQYLTDRQMEWIEDIYKFLAEN